MKKYLNMIFWILMYAAIFLVADACTTIYLLEPVYGDDAPMHIVMGHLFVVYIITIILFIIQIIIHEAGHMVCGLISGYRFSSFRIGNIIFIKDEDKIKVKKYSMPGTGGQCIMIPREDQNGNVPFVLYNLGGALANIITAVLAGIIAVLSGASGMFATCLIVFAVIGVVHAILNGVPMKTNEVDNDGRNILTLKKNPQAIKDYTNMFYIHDELSRGKRQKDIDDKYYELPKDKKMDNTMAVSTYVNIFTRELDRQDFEKAKEIGNFILENAKDIIGVHKYMVMLELMFCEIVTKGDIDKIRKTYYDKAIKQYLKASKNVISAARIQYAYCILVDKNEREAQKYLDAFYKIKKNYAYKADAQSEEELLECVKRVSNNKEIV